MAVAYPSQIFISERDVKDKPHTDVLLQFWEARFGLLLGKGREEMPLYIFLEISMSHNHLAYVPPLRSHRHTRLLLSQVDDLQSLSPSPMVLIVLL